MKSWKRLAAIALCGGALFVGNARSQDKPAGGGAAAVAADMQAMMQKWMASVKPGENHKWLEKTFVGKWNTTTRMNFDPNAPAMETKGTAEFHMINNGRILIYEAKGQMLMPDASGQMKPIPYEGMGMFGYDNYRHMFVGNWSDTTTTAILQMNGALDPAEKKLTFYGPMDEPMLDVVARTCKYVFTFESDTKFTFQVYDLHAGDNYKAFEISYERQ
jgi:hypothetical protein